MTTIFSGYTRLQKTAIFLVFALGIALTVIIFPKQIKFRYEFQKGNIWQHDNLYAPFDFVILKTNTELKTERDSAFYQSKLYFNYLNHI
jgi:cyclic-di-AMP phosphodiesterase PgpH